MAPERPRDAPEPAFQPAAEALCLPPLFSAVQYQGEGGAFDHAVAIAAEAGAGTLVHACDGRVLSMAVVFEPEEPLARARNVFFVGMAAIREALAALCPPERDIGFAWPDTILYDATRLGGGELAWPADCLEQDVPDWLVFGVQLIRTRPAMDDIGLLPESISLAEEEFEDDGLLIESFARHLMRLVDRYVEGSGEAVEDYLWRLDGRPAAQVRRIGDDGALIEIDGGHETRHGLVEGLAARVWYDPERKGPKL